MLIALKQLRLIMSYIYLLRSYTSSSCIQGYTLVKRTDYESPRCAIVPSLVTFSLSDPDIRLSTLFSDTLAFCSSRTVSHPYKATGKIHGHGRPSEARHLYPHPKDFLKNRTSKRELNFPDVHTKNERCF
jgi:hypothetical protein